MKRKKSKKIKHAVVLVNYKGWQDTIVCINSIKKTKDTPHIIVVDNGSGDESVKELKKAFPDLDLIEAGENVGFSVGNNIGIKKALRMGARVIHILNNDTEVDPNLFYRAFRYVDGKDRIAGAKIYYARGYEYHENQKNKGNIIWYAGGYFDYSMAISKHYGIDEEDKGQHDKIKDVDFISGCYIAIPRRVFSKIGMFDEQFFLYLEDSDFSLKAKKGGIELKYNPNLMVYHRNGGSAGAGSPLVDYYMTRNRFMIGKRYGSLRLRFALFREALRNLDYPIRRAAFFDYLFGKMGNKNDKIFRIIKQMDK